MLRRMDFRPIGHTVYTVRTVPKRLCIDEYITKALQPMRAENSPITAADFGIGRNTEDTR